MLVGRSGLSPVMVGREAELDRLVGLTGTLGAPAVALLAGEAGIGKTRLVQELVARARPGTVVLAGQADPGRSGRPLELLLDSLDRVAPVDDDLWAAVTDGTRPIDERVRSGIDLVSHVTAGREGLIVFEDLHWADPESLNVFEQLAQPDGGRLLLVGTYRPDGLSRRHPAAELIPRLERRHSVTHLHLRRLSQADVGNFLAAVYGTDPSFRTVEALHSRTGGNPFFLEELVSAAGDTPQDELASLPLPWTVAELVLSHVEELDPDVRRIVSAAAVLGHRVSFDLLAAVTETAEDDLIALLRTAVDAGLLVETDPDVFGFHHAIAREAIEAGLLGRERRRLHEAAFDVLRKVESDDHAALARHAEGAGRYDEMVEEARLGTHEALALGSSFQALKLAETGLCEAEDDLDLLAAAARAAWLAGLVDDASEHADRWLRLARAAGDLGEQAAALSLRMRLAYEAGDIDTMAVMAEGLIELVDRLPSDEDRAQAMAFIAQSYMLRDDIDATSLWADRAQELAERIGLKSARLAAMVEKGSALVDQPETLLEGSALLEAAADEAEAAGEHILAGRALSNLVWHARQWTQVDKVRPLVDRMRRQAEAAGFESLADSAHTEAMAQLSAAAGDLDGAIAHLDEGRRSRPTAVTWAKGRWLSVLRAGLALEAGDVDGAERYTAMAKPVTTRTAGSVLGLDFHIACRRRDLDRARSLLAEVVAAAEHDGYASSSRVHDLVSAALHAGFAPDELRPLVQWVGTAVGHYDGPDDPWRRFIDSQLAEVEGRVEEAAAGYVAAAETLATAQDVLAGHQGTVHVGAARCLVALGRIPEARHHAEEAARFLERWGGWRVEELRAVERRLGMGPEPSGPAALTPREREVAGLLAEGLTNGQLAERLYISPRTAAVHVSNILAKLGMSSRTEVATWVARGGLSEE